MTSRLTTKDFIERSRQVHGEQYDYSKARYHNNATKVCIVCKIHELEFWQVPYNHWSGQGCPQCRYVKSAKATRLPPEQFIERARKVHQNQYDYSKTRYINASTKVIIICSHHGAFSQCPYDHLAGKGCPHCGNAAIGDKVRHTKDRFVIAAHNAHNGKYDYSQVDYRSARIKVTIVCPSHGSFEQTPGHHLEGHGCPKCNYSNGERQVAQFLTSLGIVFEAQKSFPECRDKLPLRFDFYFILSGHQFLVEYQGKQHFVSIPFFEAGPKSKKLQWFRRHDRIKREFATLNGFHLIAIPYAVADAAQYLKVQIAGHIGDK